jgi:hypothetical protein
MNVPMDFIKIIKTINVKLVQSNARHVQIKVTVLLVVNKICFYLMEFAIAHVLLKLFHPHKMIRFVSNAQVIVSNAMIQLINV